MISIGKDVIQIQGVGHDGQSQEAIISLDTRLYEQEHRTHIQQLQESLHEALTDPKKSLAELVAVKKIIWQLREVMKTKLAAIPNRDPDYQIIESEFNELHKSMDILIALLDTSNDDTTLLHQRIIGNPLGALN